MFDWFKKYKKPDNVITFPEPKAELKVAPEVEPEKPALTFYRLGLTDNNRVSFQMGYSEITMNKEGCQNLIKQLEFFMNQLEDDTDE